MQYMTYPPDAGVIIDVTKPPYSLDPTGVKDCTEVLISLLDAHAQHTINGVREMEAALRASPDPNYRLPNSFENCKRNGKLFGIFPIRMPPSRIIYFPKGTYLVSDTISYSVANLQNLVGNELSWCIRFQGESREESVIKLKDACKGFGHGMKKPVVAFMRGETSNVSMSNYFRNLTIDTGRDNTGAIGLDFFGSNSAAVRDVTIRSSDSERRGFAGLVSRAGSGLLSDVAVEGFEYGIIIQEGGNIVGENISVSNQRLRGLAVEHAIMSIRGLRSDNAVPAVAVRGHASSLVLLDAELKGRAADTPGIEYRGGQLMIRNVRAPGHSAVAGYRYGGWGTDILVPGEYCEEWVAGGVCTLTPEQNPRSLNLNREQWPHIPWEHDFSLWAHPGMFGAIGDGKTDDTAAIQRAMDSGKPVIYFQPGRYRIDAPVRVPPGVRRINFCFVDLVSGQNLHDLRGAGMFRVEGESPDPLIMEDLFSFEENFGHHYLIEHASTRTLVMRDLHSQACASYRKSVPGGTVFMSNVVCTTGVHHTAYMQPGFVFYQQNAWCVQIDPEYMLDKIINDGSRLTILGFKTEGRGVAIVTKNGGQTEAFGGILLYGANDGGPAFLNEESDMAVSGLTHGSNTKHLFDVTVREVIAGETREARHDRFPRLFQSQYAIPLYVGRNREIQRS